jgi:hypothetical protein
MGSLSGTQPKGQQRTAHRRQTDGRWPAATPAVLPRRGMGRAQGALMPTKLGDGTLARLLELLVVPCTCAKRHKHRLSSGSRKNLDGPPILFNCARAYQTKSCLDCGYSAPPLAPPASLSGLAGQPRSHCVDLFRAMPQQHKQSIIQNKESNAQERGSKQTVYPRGAQATSQAHQPPKAGPGGAGAEVEGTSIARQVPWPSRPAKRSARLGRYSTCTSSSPGRPCPA